MSNEKNKWCARLAYKCAICGKEHEDVKNRVECELTCLKKQEEEKKLAAAKKKAEEQATRKKAVDDALDYAYKLKDEYIKDYGSYVYVCNADDLDLTEMYDMRELFEFVRRLP
jgi:hypothetical protein